MSIGKRIKKARMDKGLKQRQLADMMGLALITIQQYEGNKRQPKFEQLQKLALMLDTSMDYLLCLSDTVTLNLDDTDAVVSAIGRFHTQSKQYFGDSQEGKDACEKAMASFFGDISRLTRAYSHLFDDNAITDIKKRIRQAESDASPYYIDEVVKSIYNAQKKEGDGDAPQNKHND